MESLCVSKDQGGKRRRQLRDEDCRRGPGEAAHRDRRAWMAPKGDLI